MRHPKTETVVAVYTTISGNKCFIRSFSTRTWDHKLIPHYTDDPHLAHDFVDYKNAQEHIDRIVNYSKLSYQVEELTVFADMKKYLRGKVLSTTNVCGNPILHANNKPTLEISKIN